jgi:hypothetical protein
MIGRPKKPKEDIKTNITIRLNKKERECLTVIANKLNYNYSQTIRALILNKI